MPRSGSRVRVSFLAPKRRGSQAVRQRSAKPFRSVRLRSTPPNFYVPPKARKPSAQRLGASAKFSRSVRLRSTPPYNPAFIRFKSNSYRQGPTFCFGSLCFHASITFRIFSMVGSQRLVASEIRFRSIRRPPGRLHTFRPL